MQLKIRISVWQLIKQAVSDWFGKEVQGGYTTTYIWMSNQFGHFNLGFLFTLLVIWILQYITKPIEFPDWYVFIPMSQLVVWIVKETYDYFAAVHASNKSGIFPINKKDIFLDAGTAVLFIGFGLITAYLSLRFSYGIFIILISFFIGLFPSYYWMIRKMYFQQAGLPYQFRLSDFPCKIEKEEVERVTEFFEKPQSKWQHLVVYGAPKTWKTSFAAGIGTEHAFRKGLVCYTTYFKFLQMISSEADFGQLQNESKLWKWYAADIIIIDDVNPAIDNYELLSSEEFRNAFGKIPEGNKAILRNKKTVWVLGLSNREEINKWQTTFSDLLGTEKTAQIILTQTMLRAQVVEKKWKLLKR